MYWPRRQQTIESGEIHTAQAVSRRLSTAGARVRSQVTSCGICGGRSGTGGRFSPSTSVSPVNSQSTDCSTLIIIWYISPNNDRLSLTPPYSKKIKKTCIQSSYFKRASVPDNNSEGWKNLGSSATETETLRLLTQPQDLPTCVTERSNKIMSERGVRADRRTDGRTD
jgi:hypothetical protein